MVVTIKPSKALICRQFFPDVFLNTQTQSEKKLHQSIYFEDVIPNLIIRNYIKQKFVHAFFSKRAIGALLLLRDDLVFDLSVCGGRNDLFSDQFVFALVRTARHDFLGVGCTDTWQSIQFSF